MCLKLGWLWELLEDHAKLLNLVHWHRQIPPPPVRFRAYLVKLLFDNIKLLWQRSVWSLVRQPAGWCTVEKLVVQGCALLVCGHCPSSSLLCLHLLILQWTMWSHMKSYALLVCFPQGTGVFGLVISWLCVCSSPSEAPVISPSSSSPLFPHKSR